MKTLSKIPRKINAKFCYGLEFSDHFEDETVVPKLKEDKIVSPDQLKKVENILGSENTEADRVAADRMAEELLKNDPKITESANHDPEIAFNVEANEKFDFKAAQEETNKLLANLDKEVMERGFGFENWAA